MGETSKLLSLSNLTGVLKQRLLSLSADPLQCTQGPVAWPENTVSQSRWQLNDTPGGSCTGLQNPAGQCPTCLPHRAAITSIMPQKAGSQLIYGRGYPIDTTVNGKTIMAKNDSCAFP